MKLKTQTVRKDICEMRILNINLPFMRKEGRVLFFCIGAFLPGFIYGQTVEQKIQRAYAAFAKDDQLKFAISSLYVVDAKTGKVVFDRNSKIGLAPASTQKII